MNDGESGKKNSTIEKGQKNWSNVKIDVQTHKSCDFYLFLYNRMVSPTERFGRKKKIPNILKFQTKKCS